MAVREKQPRAQPADQAERDRFVNEHGLNFWVIAPAGVGKTKAIVDRIIAIASGDYDRARELLPNLVVVTYTNKAAEEMHQRARNAVVARGVDLSVLSQFNRAFFGTIHSFCLSLLRAHGHYLGLPGRLDLPEDEDALWREFLQQTDRLGASLPDAARARCLRHRSAREIVGLGRASRTAVLADPAPLKPFPEPDLKPLLNFTPDKRNEKNVGLAQQRLREWQAAYATGRGFLPLPECVKGGERFVGLWQQTFCPLREWLAGGAWAMARDVALAYREFRLARGQLTYDDQVDLARQLLRDPAAGRVLRAEGYRVILDEAQDTDPVQFDVLMELARPSEATGEFLDGLKHPPRPGHFCMVGDPQQSIYSDRADLEHYRGVRRALAKAGAAEELTFAVTFRCDRAIVETVNAVGPAMLDGADGQAEFVRLQSRPGAGAGQVVRWTPARPKELDKQERKPPVDLVTQIEAEQLAAWLKAQGLEGLRAPDWSEVAVLCPRKRWLGPLQHALHAVGLLGQIHSERAVYGDDPVYAWFTALMHVAANPDDGFELVGVLREVFGLSDQALADFAEGEGTRFQIRTAPRGRGPVADALKLLADARARAVAQPLRDGVVELVRAAGLRAQLRAILENDAEGVDRRLDALIVQAAEMEAGRATLTEWAGHLQTAFDNVVESEPVLSHAVQLITCQKAKGLQWHAVILPFLFRGIKTSRDYPLILRGEPGRAPVIVFDRAGLRDVEATLARRQKQELQRLLYVAMTRARRTLVLADDAALFGEAPVSFGAYLDVLKGVNRATWLALPAELKAAPAAEPPAAPPAEEEPLARLTAATLRRAEQQANRFPRRVLPHALAKHPLAEEPEGRIDAADAAEETPPLEEGRVYGTWWHGLMEQLDWSAPKSWTAAFDATRASSPDPERAEKEWALFLKSELVGRLGKPGLRVQTEMPFLWKRSDTECIEGLVDLALFDQAKKRWLVVDWKTNLVKALELDQLREIYAPQIQAYLEALRGITGHPAEGGLYSTATGQWIEVG